MEIGSEEKYTALQIITYLSTNSRKGKKLFLLDSWLLQYEVGFARGT